MEGFEIREGRTMMFRHFLFREILRSCVRVLLPVALLLAVGMVVPACSREDDGWYDISDRDSEARMMSSLASYVLERRQVTGVASDAATLRLSFADKSPLLLYRSRIPVIASEGGWWTVNGESRVLPVSEDVLHEVRIASDGQLTLDGNPTGFFFEASFLDRYASGSYVFAVELARDGVYFWDASGRSPFFREITDDFYVVPSYYLSHVVSKERAVEAAMAKGGDAVGAYVFFSDVHWNINYQHSPALIRHLTDFSGIRDVFFGGDVLASRASHKNNALKEGYAFQEAYSPFAPYFYCVYGNHDNNSSSQLDQTNLHLSDEEVFDYLQRQMTTVTMGPYFNFWFDDERLKVRYIGLDTGRFYKEQFRSAMPQTARFLAENLNSVPEGWQVVVVSHLWSNAVTDAQTGVASNVVPPHMLAFMKILDGYNKRKKSNFVYSSTVVPYDFTSAKGRIVYCIGGHSHLDGLFYTEGGIPVVTVATDGKKTVPYGLAVQGTTDEQCVSVFVQDFSAGQVQVFRVGRGKDFSFSFR